jgi:rhodanese-related sulfurtransferase/DNA-binding MarR family transcriptional regulator
MSLTSRSDQHALFSQFALVADALAHCHRLSLLELLAQGERRVEVLAGFLGISIASTSQHLQKLKRAGLVVDRPVGRQRLYRLSGNQVASLVLALEKVAETSLASVEKLVGEQIRSRDVEPPIRAAELRALIEREPVVLLDVRPAEEYLAGHLPGALHLPWERLRHEPPTWPADSMIVVYCRGPYCFLALEALQALHRQGYRVRRLEDGVPEWRRLGFPVEEDARGVA